MKKSILYLCFVIIVLGSFVFMSNTRINETSYTPFTNEINNNILRPDGSPGGYTGSPGDNRDCSQCHRGADFGLVPTITTSIPVTGYELGVTYEITVDASSASGTSGWGFELTAEKDLGSSIIGTFDVLGVTIGSPQRILSGQGAGNVTHSNNKSSSWRFNWTAPATDEGVITFYAAVVAVNNGDEQTETTSEAIIKSTLALDEENMLAFDIYPNPSQDFLTILLPNETANGAIEIFDYSGKSVKSKQINSVNNTLDMRNLSQGIYFIKLNSEGKIGVQKVIKK